MNVSIEKANDAKKKLKALWGVYVQSATLRLTDAGFVLDVVPEEGDGEYLPKFVDDVRVIQTDRDPEEHGSL